MDRKDEWKGPLKQKWNVYRLSGQKPAMKINIRKNRFGQVGWGWITEAGSFNSNVLSFLSLKTPFAQEINSVTGGSIRILSPHSLQAQHAPCHPFTSVTFKLGYLCPWGGAKDILVWRTKLLGSISVGDFFYWHFLQGGLATWTGIHFSLSQASGRGWEIAHAFRFMKEKECPWQEEPEPWKGTQRVGLPHCESDKGMHPAVPPPGAKPLRLQCPPQIKIGVWFSTFMISLTCGI